LRYARSVGWPYRRIKHVLRDFGRASIFVLLFFLAVVLVTLLAAWTIGELPVFLSPQNQAQWFVDLLIIIFAGIVLHFALHEKGPPVPSLVVESFNNYAIKDGRRVFGIEVRNEGDCAANDCIASLEMKEIEKPDIQANKPIEFEGSDTGVAVELSWDRTSGQKKKTLRSDGTGELMVARWMPTKRGKEEHFAIVGNRGWSSTSMRLATKPAHYFGKVRLRL
jgi:hypothetical protein